MNRLVVLLLTLVLALVGRLAQAEELKLTIDGIPSRAWLPDGQGKAPIILFSHGFGGCPAQSRFLTRALAEHGYIVVAPEHADHACGWPGKPEMPFRVPDLWDPTVFWERRQDMVRVVDALKAGTGWEQRIDWSRLGIAGHSLGGYTALGLAGAIPGWKLPGVDAVLAMSPYCTPFIYRGGLEHVRVPVMYQGGSIDRPITPTVRRLNGCYDLTPSPAWYVEIARAWHLSWTGIGFAGPTHKVMIEEALQFFDMTLKGEGKVHRVDGLTDFRTK